MSQNDTFLTLLVKRTNENKVLWQETDYEDTYEAAFSNKLLRLVPLRVGSAHTALSGALIDSQRRHTQNSHSYKARALEILNEDGSLIETLGVKGSDPSLGSLSVLIAPMTEQEDTELAPTLRRLYTAIQRQLDVPNAVISSLIEELEKD